MVFIVLTKAEAVLIVSAFIILIQGLFYLIQDNFCVIIIVITFASYDWDRRLKMIKYLMYAINEWSKNMCSLLDEKYNLSCLAYIKSEDSVLVDEKFITVDEVCLVDVDYVFIGYKNINKILEAKEKLLEYGVDENKIVSLLQSYAFKEVFCDNRISWIKDFGMFVREKGWTESVAECGVYKGETAMFINSIFDTHKLHLFDTFEGFSDNDIKEEIELGNKEFNTSFFTNNPFRKDNIRVGMQEIVLERLEYPQNVIFHKGYFPDSAFGLNEKFCFVHLDMDLYRPTLEGLRFFYDKMITGGVILIHDFFHPLLPGVKKAIEVYEQETGLNLTKITIGDGCSLAIIKNEM